MIQNFIISNAHGFHYLQMRLWIIVLSSFYAFIFYSRSLRLEESWKIANDIIKA